DESSSSEPMLVHTNLAQSSVRGPMDSLLGKLPREGGKSLLGGWLRVDSKLLGNNCP
ncbi:hypothetical protein FRX31_025299, partial [Thalictrum thalictroides]